MFPLKLSYTKITKNFMASFLGERNLDPFYKKIRYAKNGSELYHTKGVTADDFKRKIFIIQDVPNYLQAEIPEIKHIRIDKTALYPGYLIDFKRYHNFKDYLAKHFGKTSRSKLRRYQNRLETCFDITYRMYYGDMDKGQYDTLFDAFKDMLNRRFDQKEEKNYELQHWDEFKEVTYPLILEKKASLFVIYDGAKPINICMNMIYDKILFSNVSSYDIDYSIFNLGTIDMLKHIEWCFEHNFNSMDLLKGYYYYKKRWINHIYNYEHHFIYDASSITTVFVSKTRKVAIGTYFRLLHFLKKWNVHILYRNFRKSLYKSRKKTIQQYRLKETSTDDLTALHLENAYRPIDFTDETFIFLRKFIYDFLYSSSEHSTKITVFQKSDDPLCFLICGKKKYRRIKFEKSGSE